MYKKYHDHGIALYYNIPDFSFSYQLESLSNHTIKIFNFEAISPLFLREFRAHGQLSAY